MACRIDGLAGECLAAQGVKPVHRDQVGGMALQQKHDRRFVHTKLPHHHRTQLLLPWQRQLPFEARHHLRTQSGLIRGTQSIGQTTLRKVTPSLEGLGLDPECPLGFRNNCECSTQHSRPAGGLVTCMQLFQGRVQKVPPP